MIFCSFKDNISLKSKFYLKKGQSSNEKIEFTLKFIEELKSPKTMAYPGFSLPFIVNCGAREKGLGGSPLARTKWKQ